MTTFHIMVQVTKVDLQIVECFALCPIVRIILEVAEPMRSVLPINVANGHGAIIGPGQVACKDRTYLTTRFIGFAVSPLVSSAAEAATLCLERALPALEDFGKVSDRPIVRPFLCVLLR